MINPNLNILKAIAIGNNTDCGSSVRATARTCSS